MQLETLYTRHATQAQRLAYHLLRNPDDADDCVMDAVTRIAGKLDETSDNDAPKVWLGIVRHVALDMLRQRRKIGDMTEYEIEQTLNTDYASASDIRTRKGSESPIGVDLVQWVKDACTPSEYVLVTAFLDTPDITTLAAKRGVSIDSVYTAFRKLGFRLGRARHNLRAELKLAMRLRDSYGKGSRGGKTSITVQWTEHVVSLLELLDLDGSLVGTNTVKSPSGNGAWVTERTDAWGFQVALTPATLELPNQRMLTAYYSC